MFESKTADDFKSQNGYDIDGVWMPRVTKIVGIKAKPALLYYYGEAANFKAASEQSAKSAEEGTLVHEVAEKMLIGESPEVPPIIAPAIAAFQKFLGEQNITVDASHVERRAINFAHKYAGTIDALALIDGKFGVLDIKTSQAIYRDYNLQTSAYMDALVREPDLRGLETRWILRIDQVQLCNLCGATKRTKGGREKVKKPYGNGMVSCAGDSHEWGPTTGIVELKEFPFWKEDFEAFLGAKKLWEWENQYWLKKIGYI